MGEGKRKKAAMASHLKSMDGLGAAAKANLMLPTQVLKGFQDRWPAVWWIFEKYRQHYAIKSGRHAEPWCPMQTNLAMSALNMMQRAGQDRRKEMGSMGTEGALGSALEAWRHERKIFVIDKCEHGTLGDASFQMPPMPKSALDFLLLGRSGIYIATPGLRRIGGECVGVMASLEDRIVPGGTDLPPMLNLVCMMKLEDRPLMESLGIGVTYAGLDVVPKAVQIPLCDGDLFEAFYADQRPKFEASAKGNVEKLIAKFNEILRQAEELAKQGEIPEALEDFVRIIKNSPGDVESMTRHILRSNFEEAKELASLVWMAISGNYQMTLVTALDSPFGEVRLIGSRKTDPEIEEIKTTTKNQSRQEDEGGGNGNPVWRYSGTSVDVENLIANAPWAIASATQAFLHHKDSGIAVALPPSAVAVADAVENIKWQFGGDLEVSFASAQDCNPMHALLGNEDADGTSLDSIICVPAGEGPWKITLMTTDITKEYVSAERLLHVLGDFAVLSGSGIPKISKHVNVMTCYSEAKALLWSLEKVRKHYGNDFNALGQEPVRMVAGYFGAYVLAYFQGIDPRTVSFGMLQEEKRNPMLGGLILTFMDDLRYVVTFPGALGAFLQAKIGVTRPMWNSGTPAQRVKWVADGAKALLTYKDERVMNIPGGGIKWISDEYLETLKPPIEVDNTPSLFDIMQMTYDSLGPTLQSQLEQG